MHPCGVPCPLTQPPHPAQAQGLPPPSALSVPLPEVPASCTHPFLKSSPGCSSVGASACQGARLGLGPVSALQPSHLPQWVLRLALPECAVNTGGLRRQAGCHAHSDSFPVLVAGRHRAKGLWCWGELLFRVSEAQHGTGLRLRGNVWGRVPHVWADFRPCWLSVFSVCSGAWACVAMTGSSTDFPEWPVPS